MKQYTSFIESPLGCLKIVCSEEYLNAVIFCEEEEKVINHSHPLLQSCKDQLTEYFEGKRKTFELPLQQTGTPFQQKVWELLASIPFGKTLYYQQLSLQYGDAKAIRAVASANGKNNLAVIIPCHRVIGSNQTLTGYAGGLWRKKWLLEHEAKQHTGVLQMGFLFEK